MVGWCTLRSKSVREEEEEEEEGMSG